MMVFVCLLNPTMLIRRPIAELAGHLSRKGHEVGVLTPHDPAYDRKEHHLHHLKNVRIIGFRFFKSPTEMEWPIPRADFLSKLRKAADRYDVFHIWTHAYLHVLVAVFYLKLIRRKRIILTLDTLPGESFSFGNIYDLLFWIFNRTMGKWILNRADVITVYGDRLKRSIARRIRPKAPLVVLPTGITPPTRAAFASAATLRTLRTKIGIRRGEQVVTFIGIVGRRKGIDLLLDVARLFLKENTLRHVRFLVIGDASSLQVWKSRATSNVIFLGRRSDIWHVLSLTDVFFLPSRGEGLPGVVMEAMMAKVPVVTTDVPCLDMLIDHRKTGLLCSLEDRKAYAAALKMLLSSPSLRRTMASRAYKKIIKDFSWETLVPQYIQIYGGA